MQPLKLTRYTQTAFVEVDESGLPQLVSNLIQTNLVTHLRTGDVADRSGWT